MYPATNGASRMARSCEAYYYPISTMASWFNDAGLHISALLEPQPLEAEQVDDMPYHSPGWFENMDELKQVPVVCIFRAVKP